jgi:O-antigen ligase
MTPRGWVLAGAGFAIPVGSIVEPKVVLIVLALLLLAALLALGRCDGRVLPNIPWGAAWLAATILLWAALSAAWSVDPASSFKKLADLALTATAGLALLGSERRLTPRDGLAFGTALSLGITLCVLTQWSELATDGFLVRLFHDDWNGTLAPLARGISVAAILVWPALIFLTRAGARWAAIGLGAGALATFWFTDATAAALSLSAGAILSAGFIAMPRKAVGVLAVLAALWVLAAPLTMKALTAATETTQLDQGTLKDSATHRLVIWRFTSAKILERPILGYGLRAGRKVPGGEQMVMLPQDGDLKPRRVFSMHPHNGPLEWWLELGLPGAVLGALAVFFLFRWPRRIAGRTTRALVVGQLVTAFGIFNLSFGAWQVWWLVALVLAALVTLIVVENADRADLPTRRGFAPPHQTGLP